MVVSRFMRRRQLPAPATSRYFSHDPLADIDGTVLERGTAGFATCQKPHGVSIHEPHVFQVQSLPVLRFGIEDPLQLRNVFHPDSPTHRKDYECALHRSLNPEHGRVPDAPACSWERTSCPVVRQTRTPAVTHRKHDSLPIKRLRVFGNLL